MEPVFLNALGHPDQVEGASPGGFLTVEIMARDATEAFDPHHLIAGIFRFLYVGHLGQDGFLEVVDLTKESDQRAHVGFAELRHGRRKVRAWTCSLEEGPFEPSGGELRAHVGKRRRQSALITQGGCRAGEECVAGRRDAAKPTAVVAGEAIEAGEFQLEGLFGCGGEAAGSSQRCANHRALIGREVEVSPGPGLSAEASLREIQFGQGHRGRRGHTDVIMATRTTHVGEFLAACVGEGAVDDGALESGDGLIRHRQHRRRNRLARELRALHLEVQRGLTARVVII